MPQAKKTNNRSTQLVPAGETTIPMATTEKAQVNLIFAPTPEQFIKQREGRGGKVFDYVETNYVIARLNATFLCDWDLDIKEEKIFKEIGQIATKVQLTARFLNGRTISKTAWGGSSIKKTKGGEIIDIADDLKSAESDALKKAASMIGICWDVYSGITNGNKKESEVEADADVAESDDIADMASNPEENEKEKEQKRILVDWIKTYLESKTIDYKDFKLFLDETQWKPARNFVGKQFGNLSMTEGDFEDLKYLKDNIDKCIEKYLTKRGVK